MNKINKTNKIKQILYRFLTTLLLVPVLFCPLFAASHKPLPPEKAFVFSISHLSPTKVIVKWDIAPDYYLYRDRLQFSFTPKTDATIQWPTPSLMKNPPEPSYWVYQHHLRIPIILKNPAATELTVDYQGCSAHKFCYPPMEKKIALNAATISTPSTPKPQAVVNNTTSASLTQLMTSQEGVRKILAHQNLMVLLLIFAGLGLLLSFTPCVLPMIPILTGIIVGQKQSVGTKKAFWLSSAYVLGTSITYALTGVAAALLGQSLQAWLQKPWIILFVSLLFILLALSLFGLYELRLPSRLQNRMINLSNRQRGGTYVGVFCMGMISTLIISPCVTAPLVGVLIYISQTGNVGLGAGALFALGIGMGMPLLLIGTTAGKWLPKSGQWMGIVKKGFGILMLGMAIWIGLRVITPAAPSASFIVVNNLPDLKQELATAKQDHVPVILDFYADWCESCVLMDKEVFDKLEVKKVLSAAHYTLIRADLTENSDAEEAMQKAYDVIAPPTVIFFNAAGEEKKAVRIVGEVDAKEFLEREKHAGS